MKKLLVISMFIIGSLSFATEGINASTEYSKGGILVVDEINIEIPVLNLTDRQEEEANLSIANYNEAYNKAKNQIELVEIELAAAYEYKVIDENTVEDLLAEKYTILEGIEKEYIKANKEIDNIIAE